MAKTLTKKEVVDHLNKVMGLSKRDALLITESFFDQISQVLENNEEVRLSGFGNFKLRDKRARIGRNPKTGEEVEITSRRVVTFTAGKKFRKALASRASLLQKELSYES